VTACITYHLLTSYKAYGNASVFGVKYFGMDELITLSNISPVIAHKLRTHLFTLCSNDWLFLQTFLCIPGPVPSREGITTSTTNPRCHGNEMWDKIGYNSNCMRDIFEMLASNGRFWDQAIQWCQSNFKRTNPGWNGNEIWDKMGYTSACVVNITAMLAPARGFSRLWYWMISEKFYH